MTNDKLTCPTCGGVLAKPVQIMCEWDTPLNEYCVLTFCWGCNREWLLDEDDQVLKERKRGNDVR